MYFKDYELNKLNNILNLLFENNNTYILRKKKIKISMDLLVFLSLKASNFDKCEYFISLKKRIKEFNSNSDLKDYLFIVQEIFKAIIISKYSNIIVDEEDKDFLDRLLLNFNLAANIDNSNDFSKSLEILKRDFSYIEEYYSRRNLSSQKTMIKM